MHMVIKYLGFAIIAYVFLWLLYIILAYLKIFLDPWFSKLEETYYKITKKKKT